MNIRDRVEATIRAWHIHEIERGAAPVIDFDCHPEAAGHVRPVGRLDTLSALDKLRIAAAEEGNSRLIDTIHAHASYIRALLGERTPLDQYIRDTQGCAANGWPSNHVEGVRARAVEAVEELGIKWGASTEDDLEALEGPLAVEEAPDAIRQGVADLERRVRTLTGSTATYQLRIETTNTDAYWSYWLDGAGDRVRLRLNLRNARFTSVRAQQFALHEILGHALQSATYTQRCHTSDVPWVRLLAVHAQHQVMLEGIAQAMPLFVVPENAALTTRVRVDHLCQLVLAKLHLAINSGESVEYCAEQAQSLIPFWSTDRVGNMLADRSTNPQLRSYLWAYPAGLDWFATLASEGTTVQVQEVLRAAYHDPLTPTELHALWPAGPTIGGA